MMIWREQEFLQIKNMIAEKKYSVKRSRDKVKELIQKAESKRIEMKKKWEKRRKSKNQPNILLISIMERKVK